MVDTGLFFFFKSSVKEVIQRFPVYQQKPLALCVTQSTHSYLDTV